jgi:hypothetical protein
LFTGDGLDGEPAPARFPAQSADGHAAKGKRELHRYFESQRRIKVYRLVVVIQFDVSHHTHSPLSLSHYDAYRFFALVLRRTAV